MCFLNNITWLKTNREFKSNMWQLTNTQIWMNTTIPCPTQSQYLDFLNSKRIVNTQSYGFKTWTNKNKICWFLHMNIGKTNTTIQTTTNCKHADIDEPYISRLDTIPKTKIIRMKTFDWKRMFATQFQISESWRPNQSEPNSLALQTHDAWIPNRCWDASITPCLNKTK